jgi:hypothetical protein
MTDALPTNPTTPECARFEAQLGPWLEQELSPSEQAFMTAHRAQCAACDALMRDLEQIVADASALPALSPPRDLWAGIAERLETEVVPLPTAARRAPGVAQWSVRRLGAAAAALMAITAGVTWQFATRSGGDGVRTDSARVAAAAPVTPQTPQTPDSSLVVPKAELVVGRPEAVATPVANSAVPVAPGVTYEREIVALRRIVNERFTELDSTTVSELRRNLQIIDQAIADSRKALAKDPRSAFVAQQLDRALEAKLELMRKVALL